jgi:hypothetical protein
VGTWAPYGDSDYDVLATATACRSYLDGRNQHGPPPEDHEI